MVRRFAKCPSPRSTSRLFDASIVVGGPPPSVAFGDVAAAAKRLRHIAHRTPVATSRTLNSRVGASVFCKLESFQRTGSFKLRGAYNALSQLDATACPRGILTYSSGNHAQATALAGNLLGLNATIIMPRDAPRIKLQATRAYGATIVEYDRSEVTRETLARRLSAERGLPIIPPYDHAHIVAGQGTAALELLQDIHGLDYVLAPCGGGGLLSGSALAVRALRPQCQVVGVEPANADDATQSFRTGVLHSITNPDTIADGARTPSLGKVTFPLIQDLVDDMVTVTEAAILHATQFLWERMKLVVEPTGSLAVAALLSGAFSQPGKRIGVIISGGNADLASLGKMVAVGPT